MNLKLQFQDEKFKGYLAEKKKSIPAFFRKFLDDATAIYNKATRDPVLGGQRSSRKGRSQYLGRVTGRTYEQGFKYVKHVDQSGRKQITFYTGHFWARISNMFENWKDANRVRIPISKQARLALEKDSQFNQEIEQLIRKVTE